MMTRGEMVEGTLFKTQWRRVTMKLCGEAIRGVARLQDIRDRRAIDIKHALFICKMVVKKRRIMKTTNPVAFNA